MIMKFERKRTSTVIVIYSSSYLYFLALSLRNVSKALDVFNDKKRSYILLNWINGFDSYHIYKRCLSS